MPLTTATRTAPSGYTGDNESYSTTKNRWKTKARDPTPVAAPCSGVVGKALYVAGGEVASGVTGIAEAYTLKTNSWQNEAAMPQALVGAASANAGGLLYCIGGANQGYPNGGATFYNDVQVYQP